MLLGQKCRLTAHSSRHGLAVSVPLSRFASRVGDGAACYFRHFTMTNLSPLKLVIGGSREGRDYRFIGDADSLRQLALNLIARLDGKEAGPWKSDPSVIVCDTIELERDIFSKRKEAAFLSFQLKNTSSHA